MKRVPKKPKPPRVSCWLCEADYRSGKTGFRTMTSNASGKCDRHEAVSL